MGQMPQGMGLALSRPLGWLACAELLNAHQPSKAGRFFDEAVKAAPAYFKGRRYQFLNFVKNTFGRSRG